MGIAPHLLPPRPPDLLAEGGRGLFMIWTLMNSVYVAGGSGAHLVMVKELFPKRAEPRTAVAMGSLVAPTTPPCLSLQGWR